MKRNNFDIKYHSDVKENDTPPPPKKQKNKTSFLE